MGRPMPYKLYFIYLIETILTVSVASLNGTDSITTAATTTTIATELTYPLPDETEKISYDPFWIAFTVVLLVALLIVPVVISLAVGLYKFYQHARVRGHYKQKCRVYGEKVTNTPNFDMFTVEKAVLPPPGIQTSTPGVGETQTACETNTRYEGETNIICVGETNTDCNTTHLGENTNTS